MFAETDLSRYEIGPEGYLPERDPLVVLPAPFAAWEQIAQHLPKLLAGDRIRETLADLPPFPVEALSDPREWRRAMCLLSYLGHAYVWGGARPVPVLPARLAQPWHSVATHMGRPPVLSYASYALDNWVRLDPARAPELGNIALIQNFMGGIDEEWFILIHVEIERLAGPAVRSLLPVQQAAGQNHVPVVLAGLRTIESSLREVVAVMRRMPEWCDPYVYYHRVRPYIHGWKNHPDLPEGLVYEGVEAYGGQPQQFRGETGAQSGIVPALDALFGVAHAADVLKEYLMEMRLYMPPAHRAYVEALEQGPSLRDWANGQGAEIRQLFDACVEHVEVFRSIHLEYAATYIFKQAQTDAKNPHAVGTGGTPFMPYLKKHRDETASAGLGANLDA